MCKVYVPIEVQDRCHDTLKTRLLDVSVPRDRNGRYLQLVLAAHTIQVSRKAPIPRLQLLRVQVPKIYVLAAPARR